MRLDYTGKVMLAVGIVSLSILVIVFGIFLPTARQIKKTTDDTNKLRLFLEQKYNQSVQYALTRKKINEIKEASPQLVSHIFRAGDELKLITYLEGLSAKYKLSQNITSANFEKSKNNQITISLNISGDYMQTLKYLAELEASDYFLNIEQLQLAPLYNRNGEPTPSTNLYLTLGLYVSQ